MAGGFPQAAVEQQRSSDFEIAGRVEPAAHIVFDDAIELPALGMPEDAADRLLLHMEQVELAAEPAVVAPLGLLETEEILVELLLARPGGAVDALQLSVVRVAAPIGSGHIHQLEGLPEPPRRGQMRPDAQIDEVALAVEADLLLGRDLADIFRLVAFADAVEEGDRLVALPHLAGDRLVAAYDVAHALLDAREIVVEAGFGRRAEGNLGLGVQFLDRLGHDMSGVVAQDLDPLGHLAGDDRDRRVMVDQRRQIARPAVDLDRDRRPGEAGADRRGQLRAGHRTGKFPGAAVGQGHDHRARRARPLGRRTTPPLKRARGRRDLVGVHRVTCAPSIMPCGRGETVTKKPRPLPAGSIGFELCVSISARDLPAPRSGW